LDKPGAQRTQAIIALMVGAFTFGCYMTFHEAKIAADKSMFEQQIRAHKDREEKQNIVLSRLIERVIRLEILARP
jgi:hypothetical protein